MTENRMIDQIAEVTNTRRNMNGKPLLNFLRVAIYWMDYLASQGKSALITPEDVCWMMVLFKIARQDNTFQADNILDGIGYLDCLDTIHRQMQELGYPLGAETLRTMTKPELEALRDKLVIRQRIARELTTGTEPVFPGLVLKEDTDSTMLTWAEQRRQQIAAENQRTPVASESRMERS